MEVENVWDSVRIDSVNHQAYTIHQHCYRIPRMILINFYTSSNGIYEGYWSIVFTEEIIME